MKLSTLASMGLLLTVLGTAQAQFTYTNVNNSTMITGYTGPGGAVVVPGTLGGAPVRSLGPQAFFLATSVNSILLPASVTNIASGAFSYCFDLLAINVNAGNPVYSSAGGVLFDASRDTLVQFPGGVTGDYTIPDSVTNIATDAFYSTRINEVTIPPTVTTIGPTAFASCLNLTAITVDPGNLYFLSVDGVLFDYSQSTLLQYPGNLNGPYAIPNTVLNIGPYAFQGSYGLTSVSIPASVTNTGYLPFFDCTALQAINVDPANLFYSSINGVLFDQAQTTLLNFPGGLNGSYVVPPGISSIGPEAFAYSPLASITFPASLTNIQDYAFAYCDNLATATFLGNPPTFDNTAFVGDDLLQFLYLPGATGWTSPLQSVPALLWNPVIQSSPTSPAVVNNKFGFTITGTPGIDVEVQGSTNLASGLWVAAQTLTLTNGTANFSGPAVTNYPAAFFRLSTP